jgi:hypothetical protein
MRVNLDKVSLSISMFPYLFQCRKVYVTLIHAIQHQKPLKRQWRLHIKVRYCLGILLLPRFFYRRITVSSVIGKLFEKVILHKISPLLKESQNPLQRGVSKDVAPTNASLLLTEAIAESLDRNQDSYSCRNLITGLWRLFIIPGIIFHPDGHLVVHKMD